MSDPLSTYLTDHVAGSLGAVNLLRFLRNHYRDEPLGRFAADLLVDVEKDRAVLEDLLERIGTRRVGHLKEGVAWVGEKIARIKLQRYSEKRLGALLALESLEMGIRGKFALWRALDVVAQYDSRLQGVDFGPLWARAQEQYERVEKQRLDAARATFQAGSPSAPNK